jgi:hypothetical protein
MDRTRVYIASPFAPFITVSQWTLEVGVAEVNTLRNVGPRIFGGGRYQKSRPGFGVQPASQENVKRIPHCRAQAKYQ